MSKKIFSLLFLVNALTFSAQNASGTGPQMADAFRENGKIYVVISVIGIVFLCIVLFLVYLERKIKRLEQEINKTPRS